MYLKIEPEAFEPTVKNEEIQIVDLSDTEDDFDDFSEKSGEDD